MSLAGRCFGGSLLAVLLWTAVAAQGAIAQAEDILPNPSMTAGTDMPAGWKVNDDSKGKIKLSRDTETFHSAPASLRIETIDTGSGTVNAAFSSLPPGPFGLSGFTRTAGNIQTLRYDLQVFDTAWKQITWITSDDNEANKLHPSVDWQAFTRRVTLPDGAAHVIFYFDVKGSGQVWLDDLQVAAPPKADFNAAADAKPILVGQPVKVLGSKPYRWANAIMGGVEYCTDLIFNPKHPELMYSRNDTGGIYRFDRKAGRWVQLMDGIPFKWSQLFVADSFALDANHPDVTYVAAGGGRWGSLSDVIKTVDGGKTWFRTYMKNAQGKDVFADAGGDDKPAGERLVVDPNSSNILFYGTRSDGMFMSRDAAKTWLPVSSFPTKGSIRNGITFVTFDARGGQDGKPTQALYAGVHSGPTSDDPGAPVVNGGVYGSQDGGTSWKLLNGTGSAGPDQKSSPTRGRIGLDGTLYVSFNGGAGLWKWKTGVWTDITPPAGKGKAFSGIGLHPTDPRQLLSITFDRNVPIFYSGDGGATWTNYSYQPGGNGNIVLDFQPAWEMKDPEFKWPTGYCATVDFDPLDPTVGYETDFSGANKLVGIGGPTVRVSLLSAGREQMTMGDVVSPSGGAPLISGAWDIGGFRHTDLNQIPTSRLVVTKSDGSAYTGWDSYRNSYQDVFQLDANPLHPDNIVAAGGWQWNNTGDASYSDDNGKAFHVFASKPFPDAKFGRIAIGVDPNNIVWAPMGDTQCPVYFTRDNGKTWTPCKGAPLGTVASNGPWSFYKLVAADRVEAGVFYIYDRRDGRFYRSEDGGAAWKHVSRLPGQQGAHFDVHKIQAAPGMAGVVWAALKDRGLFASEDGGDTWTRFPNIPWAQSFAWGRGGAGGKVPSVYLFGQIGGQAPASEQDANVQLYRSDDLGKTWVRINDDAHGFAGFNSMTGDGQVEGRVYVSTGGRGVFYGEPAG